MFYVYVLQSTKDGSVYLGSTNNLKRRITEHNGGRGRSTKTGAPFHLVYYEAFRDESEARLRERNLKRYALAYQQLMCRIAKSLS